MPFLNISSTCDRIKYNELPFCSYVLSPVVYTSYRADSSQQDYAEQRRESLRALKVLVAAVSAGLVLVIVYALQDTSQLASVIAIGIMVSGACLAVGGLLGFLFGIPRALQQDRLVDPASGTLSESEREDGRQRVRYQANTNVAYGPEAVSRGHTLGESPVR